MSTTASRMAAAEEMERGEFVWLENLKPNMSRFTQTATGQTYLWGPKGYAGSVLQVPKRVANDPYIRRAIDHGAVRLLGEREAEERLGELVIPDDVNPADRSASAIREALAAGASESLGTRYRKEGLSEFGESRKDIRADEVWGGGKTDPALPAPEPQGSGVPSAPTRPAGPTAPGAGPHGPGDGGVGPARVGRSKPDDRRPGWDRS